MYYSGVQDKATESKYVHFDFFKLFPRFLLKLFFDSFVYESSGDPIEFALWDEGEPSNHDGQEHCVEVVTIKDGKWNDIPCSWKVGFICQNQAHQSNQTRPSSGQKEIMFDC